MASIDFFGHAAGALVCGIVADLLGIPSAMWTVGMWVTASGLLVVMILRESLAMHHS